MGSFKTNYKIGNIMDWKTCFQGKKILIAEDDSVSQELMKDIFQQMNCTVEIAKDGSEAVEKFKQGSYDLVLMDVRMPNKDGMEATKEIRAFEGSNRHTTIFALTASVLENKEPILQAGVDDLIPKPINIEELRNKMAKFLLEKK